MDKPVSINLEVIGYNVEYGKVFIGVRLSGQGPRGKLQGIFKVYEKFSEQAAYRVSLNGDGRWSAMHGNKSLDYSEQHQIVPDSHVLDIVAEWKKLNPFARLEYDVLMAESNLHRVKSQIEMKRSNIQRLEREIKDLEIVMPSKQSDIDQAKARLESAKANYNG